MTRDVVRLGLEHGVALSVVMTAVVLASLRHDPRIWQGDAPKAMQDEVGPAPPETARRKKLWSVVVLIAIVSIFAALLVRLPGVDGGDAFLARFVASYVAFALFNLVDATLIDVGVLLVWAPAWAFVPGTRHHPALRDPAWHLANAAKGFVGGVPFALFWAALGFLGR